MSESRKRKIYITNGIDERMFDPTDIIPSGWRRGRSDSSRDKLRKAIEGRICSEETRRKMSESKQNPSQETRCKLSEANKGRIWSEETRRKLSETNKGRAPWNKGKSEVYSDEMKQKMSEFRKGTIFITDGINNRVIHSADIIPSGWNKGRSHRRNTVASGSDIYAFLDGNT